MIAPIETGGSDVFLHARYFSGMRRNFGDLELDFDTMLDDFDFMPKYRDPQHGDLLVYSQGNNLKGIFAMHWTFAKDWDRVEKLNRVMQERGQGFIRIMRSGNRENRFRPTLVWKGTHDEFMYLLDSQDLIFDKSIYTEELGINGSWKRTYRDPRNWHPKYMPQ
jgi:hypothetical protein